MKIEERDCKELGPKVKFRMKVTGANEARLWKLQPGKTPTADGLKLVRRQD